MAKRELTPEELTARKAQQSKTGKSNVARSKSHERQIANLLTEWSGREFRRRRVEGRDVTVIERESTADVIPVRGDIHCSIEAKCGRMPSFDALLANPAGSRISENWHQCCYDVFLVQKVFNRKFYPMMFFRPEPALNWVAISAHIFRDGVLNQKSPNGDAVLDVKWTTPWFPHFYFDAYSMVGEVSFNVVRTSNKANYRFIPLHLDPMVLCRWKDFAANVNPDSFFLSPPTKLL